MAIVDSSVPFACQIALNASEAQRQSDESIALQAQNVRGGHADGTAGAIQAAYRSAAIADFRRRIVISNAYGGNPAPWIEGLKSLGINSLY
jgi:hypothetical protein